MITSKSKTDDNVLRLHEVAKALRLKPVVIAKADKSNNVVILDETDYEDKVMKLIAEGPYIELKENPLKNMVNEVNDVLKKHQHKLTDNPKSELRKWKVSNPRLPSYVLQ